ncbi:MAG TPA: hypothetical protein VFC71_02580 [Candidatus Polarisedimenticolia bacterium]|nr:hypothetical protein [Candidatus Polarisedimenticolia bacterium]
MNLRRNLLLACACLLAACGGTTSTAPSATPNGPTPTPINVERAFLDTVTDSGFSGGGTISGTVAIGEAAGTIDGTFKGDADTFEQVWNLKSGTTMVATDRISTADGGWERVGAGPWLALPPPTEPPLVATSLPGWLATLTTLAPSSADDRGGTPVTHLKPPADAPAIPPEVVGFDTNEVTTPSIRIDLYAATATGAPVAADVQATWTQLVLGVPTAATYTFTYTFTDVGSDVTIEPPTDVWTLTANAALGYQIAMPSGWKVAADGDRDVFSTGGVPTVFVRANGNATGLTLDEFRAAITATYHATFGEPQSMTVSTLDGAKANYLKYGVSAGSGTPQALLDRITMHGAGWEVSMVTPAGPTAADEDLFDIFCASFAFTK